MQSATPHRLPRLALLFVLPGLTLGSCQSEAQRPAGRSATSPSAIEGQQPAPTTQVAATADPSRVSLLVFGDWGRNSRAEREVARAINAYARTPATRFDAGLLLGDNFYFPLSGVDDPRWRTLFEELYEPPNLRFWAALGNHDYSTAAGPQAATRPATQPTPARPLANKDVELAYSRQHPGGRFNLPAAWYRLDLPAEPAKPAGQPLVSILMLDSDYREKLFRPDDWERQNRWLAGQLEELRPTDPSKPRRRWVICCAHHPIFTNGSSHADDERLKKDWLPLFERHGVDFYLAGHNHDMEHMQVPGVNIGLIVSGGGGASLYGETHRHPGWFSKSYGFTHLLLQPDRAEAYFVDQTGRVLYSLARTPNVADRAASNNAPLAIAAGIGH